MDRVLIRAVRDIGYELLTLHTSAGVHVAHHADIRFYAYARICNASHEFVTREIRESKRSSFGDPGIFSPRILKIFRREKKFDISELSHLWYFSNINRVFNESCIDSRRSREYGLQKCCNLWNIHPRHEKSQVLKVIRRKPTLPRVSRKSLGAVFSEKRHHDYFLITYPL